MKKTKEEAKELNQLANKTNSKASKKQADFFKQLPWPISLSKGGGVILSKDDWTLLPKEGGIPLSKGKASCQILIGIAKGSTSLPKGWLVTWLLLMGKRVLWVPGCLWQLCNFSLWRGKAPQVNGQKKRFFHVILGFHVIQIRWFQVVSIYFLKLLGLEPLLLQISHTCLCVPPCLQAQRQPHETTHGLLLPPWQKVAWKTLLRD